MAILYQVVNKNHTIDIDTLYISEKTFLSGWRNPDRFMFRGVSREKGKGVPSGIFQKKETSKISHAKARWALKVATLKGDLSIPIIVALSLYDSKPFYFMSNSCEVFKWKNMTHKVWSKDSNRMVEMTFFRLNLIHYYNI